MHTNDKDVKISKGRYKELLDKEKILNALMAGGVDNWEGYEISLEFLDEDE